MVLELNLLETGPGKFLLDTGATTSVIYREAILAGTIIDNGEHVRIHDMNLSATRPTATIQNFLIGSTVIQGVNFAILDQPQYSDPLLHQTKGIIGLDVLAAYRLVIDPIRQKLFFIDAQSPPLTFDKTWMPIAMNEHPFKRDVLGLHFLELEVNGMETFALVDTGSEFNVMNWNFKRLRELRVKRRRLHKTWKVTGAIGEFKPQWAVILEGIKFGNRTWPHQLFAVYQLGLFDAMELEDKPLMIAGMPFFSGKTVLIDFAGDVMWIKMESSPN